VLYCDFRHFFKTSSKCNATDLKACSTTLGKLAIEMRLAIHQANELKTSRSANPETSTGWCPPLAVLAPSAELQAGTPTPRPPVAKLTLVYFDAGGGHRSTMEALKAVIQQQERPWEIAPLNLQELLDPLDPGRRIAGVRGQDFYNLLLRNGWTLGTAQLMPILHALIRFYHSRIVHHLESHWRESEPDIVVSLIPHFNRQLAISVRKALSRCPFVTILTDLADYPPHWWIESESEYLVCGTERSVQQALAMGHPADRIFPTSGMILNPRFYADELMDQRRERLAVGLEPHHKTGLVLFGGQGSQRMLDIARELSSMKDLQLIFITGRNAALTDELQKVRFRGPAHIEGFTPRIPSYMRLADFFIGKPGPGSISEALFMGLPVIVESNAWTLPQERFNAEWIQEKDVGLVVRSFRQISETVCQMLQPETLARFRRNALALRNQAVFEIPEIIETILQRTGRRPVFEGVGAARAARFNTPRIHKETRPRNSTR
jgi:hypothetical protein